MLMLQRPEITQEDLGNNRTKFIIEPLEPGFGLTLGNTMRRALLSRVPGVAVTGIKISGVNHEFTSIPGVVEDVLDLLLNLKRLVLKVEDQENHTLTLKSKGPGQVLASQIQCPSGWNDAIRKKDAHVECGMMPFARRMHMWNVE